MKGSLLFKILKRSKKYGKVYKVIIREIDKSKFR